MSIEILATADEYVRARTELRRREIDFTSSRPLRALYKLRIMKGEAVGDIRKSWDVLKTFKFVEERVSKRTPVLDIGAYASEILSILHKERFADLAGIDLNPRLARMPHAGAIKYVLGDFTQTPFQSEAFGAVTAISVLEHGFRGASVFKELSRILKPEGYFVGSVDYWPEKIDTSGIKAFGVDWKIFSREELMGLIDDAASNGMVPVGPLDFQASERAVSFCQRQYTFAWFAFQKLNGAVRSDKVAGA